MYRYKYIDKTLSIKKNRYISIDKNILIAMIMLLFVETILCTIQAFTKYSISMLALAIAGIIYLCIVLIQVLIFVTYCLI